MNITVRVRLIIGLILITIGMQNVGAQVQQSIINTNREQWHYVQQEFLKLTGECTGITNKIGNLLSEYLTLPLANIGGGLALVGGSTVYEQLIEDDFELRTIGGERERVRTKEPIIEDRLTVKLASLGLSFIIGTALTYKLCKMIGQWLIAKNVVAENVLKQYLLQWDAHKVSTPVVLKPVFDELSQDLQQNNNIFTKINQQEAQQIIEVILTKSLISTIA